MTVLLVISMYLGSYEVIITRTFYPDVQSCQTAMKKVKSRTHRILWKECK